MPSIPPYVHDAALLYLAMAHGTDDYLSDAELRTVTDRLHERLDGVPRPTVQDAVMEAMSVYLDAPDDLALATGAMLRLRGALDAETRASLLDDLLAIARADGVVLDNERGLLASLSECWGVVLPRGARPAPPHAAGDAPDVLGHLAFLYLVLAHGADSELSDDELRVIRIKLQGWQKGLDDDDVDAVLDRARTRYAHGPDEDALHASIDAVRDGLPPDRRRAALSDLIAIANADGVFLDHEEDLINTLVSAWDVGAYSGYRTTRDE